MGAGSQDGLGGVHLEIPVTHLSVDGWKRETEKKRVVRDEDRSVPTGLGTEQAGAAVHEQLQ